MEGTVKFYNRKKGFGFVSGEDGQDYFVHFTALPRGTFLRDGDKVSFTGTTGERGPKAENVQVIGGGEGGAPRRSSGQQESEDMEE